jgi:hypothetical protein
MIAGLSASCARKTRSDGERIMPKENVAAPPEVATKVSQARSHSFYIKEGNNALVLVSPNDRRVADAIY